MKRLPDSRGRLEFHLGENERLLFEHLLRLYPVVPPAHQQITRGPTLLDAAAEQKLLDEALAEQRQQSRKRIEILLQDLARLKSAGNGSRLSLPPADLEWLLQVLNDIRVGSWVRLGSPDRKFENLPPGHLQHLWAMEGAGFFQMALLESLTTPSENL